MISHRWSVHRTARRLELFTIAATFCIMLTPVAARADVVLDWNIIAVNSAIQAGQNPFAQARSAAIVQLAVFTAVNAITNQYQPYISNLTAPPAASADAAAVVAAYRVLSTHFGANPTIQATLDSARAASLAAIPDAGEAEGIATGEVAAAAILALRANDGSAPAQFYTPPSPAPGEWEATSLCPRVAGEQVGALRQWRNVVPFGVESVRGFLSPPPPLLTSNEYAKAYNELLRVGSVNSTETDRPQDRRDVVNFYALSSPTFIFNMIARQLAESEGRSLSDNARSLALLNMAISDALVASFNAKYEYTFWRPETAIRA